MSSCNFLMAATLIPASGTISVSYTHLDVYKRQVNIINVFIFSPKHYISRAVSYTHLDVYKRQFMFSFFHKFAPNRFGKRFVFFYIENPVSYTHLDVYKRQTYICSERHFFSYSVIRLKLIAKIFKN